VPAPTETLTLERIYEAAPQRVFEAWTQVDVLGLWFGCAPDTFWKVHLWEPRAGGRIHVSLDFDGHPFEVRGQFLIVDAPKRLRYRWSGDEVVEVTFEAHGSGTKLRVAHTFPAGAEARTILTAGWSASIEQLGRV